MSPAFSLTKQPFSTRIQRYALYNPDQKFKGEPMRFLLAVSFLFLSSCALNPFLTGKIDRDGDGVALEEDCDDTDPLIGIMTWYLDNDRDGFGTTGGIKQCDPIDNYASQTGDCDDTDLEVHPNTEEVCDGIDNNCDEVIDTDAVDIRAWYRDADQDTFGNPDRAQYACDQPDGYVSDNTDCDDAQTTTNPNSPEVCGDSVDNDCDGETDTDADYFTWYADMDGDAFGNPEVSVSDCRQPDGYVTDHTDCDDADTDVNPSVEEICNDWIDNNCDGGADECALTGDISMADADVKFVGPVNQTKAGNIVSSAGDHNGDGFTDLLISAFNDDTSNVNAGAVYLVFGPVTSTGLFDLANADSILTGELAQDYAGSSIASEFDINDDGFDDLLVSSPFYDAGGTYRGIVYLVLGPTTGTTSLTTSLSTFIGESNDDYVGRSLSIIDCDGIGQTSLLIGSPDHNANGSNAGAVYLILNPTDGQTTLSNADGKFIGEFEEDYAGTSITSLSLNGDVYDDLLIGAPADDTSSDNAGAIYVFNGPIPNGTINLADADQKILGENAYDRAGSFLHSLADVNMDGNEDFFVGAPYVDNASSSVGATYLLLGSTDSISPLYASQATFLGINPDDRSGSAASQAGDVDQDGNVDFLFASIYHDAIESNVGATYLFYGPVSGTYILSSADSILVGEEYNDYAGTSVSGVGDQNLDGYDDFLIGSPENNISAGAAYLFFGLGL